MNLIENERVNEEKDNVLETTEEVSNTKKNNYDISNWGKIKMLMKLKKGNISIKCTK